MQENTISRQVVLDTETTGMNKMGVFYQDHRIIEIGCVEVINRRLTGRHYHVYLNPERAIDEEAIGVHGITDARVANEPKMAEVVDEFLDFIRGAELVIHNAQFDVGFLDYEMQLLGRPERMAQLATITDTLAMARQRFPGKRNNLDALCDRLGVDNSKRELHGALLDAQILADVYLLMTGGQTALTLHIDEQVAEQQHELLSSSTQTIWQLPVISATVEELAAHQAWIDKQTAKGGACLWLDE